jgi:hypothetical protein
MAKNEDKKILIGRRPVRSKNRREQGGGRADGITCQALSCRNSGFIDGFLNLGGLQAIRALHNSFGHFVEFYIAGTLPLG